MKPRSSLTASEVEQLWARLERQLDWAALQTQPEIAGQVLDLVSNPAANLRDFAQIIRGDAALAGRLLRFANSAHFAQRQPVSNLERACVLLGLERLKAISLGFFLSRAAAPPSQPRQPSQQPSQQPPQQPSHQPDPHHLDHSSAISRRIWGESVYRGCIAAELAKVIAPRHQPEAFIIGLMLDSGIPLMHRMIGPRYEELLQRHPTDLFKAEVAELPCTHVDVVAALSRRWRLPELLALPLQHHHAALQPGAPDDLIHRLQRLAQFVGSLQLQVEPQAMTSRPPVQTASRQKVLGIDPHQLQQLIRRATDEYAALQEVFRDVADSVSDLTDVALRVHQQLVAITDQVILHQLSMPSSAPSIPPTSPSACFSIAGQRVEVEVDSAGKGVAYLRDSAGMRLLSYNFELATASRLRRPDSVPSARQVLEGLGLEAGAEAEELESFLRAIAA
jgi:HD-like signal output (HDOD) protein